MEVHHHPQMEKKNLKEYFTQFILPKMPSEATQSTTICKDYCHDDSFFRNKNWNVNL
jgi:hypothetical protein